MYIAVLANYCYSLPFLLFTSMYIYIYIIYVYIYKYYYYIVLYYIYPCTSSPCQVGACDFLVENVGCIN